MYIFTYEDSAFLVVQSEKSIVHKKIPSSVPLVLYPNGIATTFLKNGFVDAGGVFYSYYIHQGDKLKKERKIVRKSLNFMHTKGFNTYFKYGCNSTSTTTFMYLLSILILFLIIKVVLFYCVSQNVKYLDIQSYLTLEL